MTPGVIEHGFIPGAVLRTNRLSVSKKPVDNGAIRESQRHPVAARGEYNGRTVEVKVHPGITGYEFHLAE